MITTKYYSSIIVEMLLLLIAPYPGLSEVYIVENYIDKGISVNLSVNNILLFLAMIIRIYLILRFLLIFTRYKNSRS